MTSYGLPSAFNLPTDKGWSKDKHLVALVWPDAKWLPQAELLTGASSLWWAGGIDGDRLSQATYTAFTTLPRNISHSQTNMFTGKGKAKQANHDTKGMAKVEWRKGEVRGIKRGQDQSQERKGRTGQGNEQEAEVITNQRREGLEIRDEEANSMVIKNLERSIGFLDAKILDGQEKIKLCDKFLASIERADLQNCNLKESVRDGDVTVFIQAEAMVEVEDNKDLRQMYRSKLSDLQNSKGAILAQHCNTRMPRKLANESEIQTQGSLGNIVRLEKLPSFLDLQIQYSQSGVRRLSHPEHGRTAFDRWTIFDNNELMGKYNSQPQIKGRTPKQEQDRFRKYIEEHAGHELAKTKAELHGLLEVRAGMQGVLEQVRFDQILKIHSHLKHLSLQPTEEVGPATKKRKVASPPFDLTANLSKSSHDYNQFVQDLTVIPGICKDSRA